MNLPALLACAAAMALTMPAAGELPTPQEAQQRWRARLEGRHFTATLLLTEEGKGTRRMTIRRDESEGRERVLLRIEEPHSAAGESWLLREEPGGDALYAHSANERSPRVRRIPSLRARDPLSGADGWRARTRRPKPRTTPAASRWSAAMPPSG